MELSCGHKKSSLDEEALALSGQYDCDCDADSTLSVAYNTIVQMKRTPENLLHAMKDMS